MRKISVVVHSRANYGRVKTVLQAILKHPKLELQIIVGASALLYRYGDLPNIISKDGLVVNSCVHSIVEGDTPKAMAKSTGLTIIELANEFERLKPDIVLTVADRYETLATAVAASYMNITLAHTQGGEVTGSIDESVRHAITKLAHIHFPATKLAEKFIVKMGEKKENVYFTGCPAIDLLHNTDLTLDKDFFSNFGSGTPLDEKLPFIIIMQHPVTTEYGNATFQIRETISAVKELLKEVHQVLWFWPHIDAGSDEISKELRILKDTFRNYPLQFVRNLGPETYAQALNNCACIVGNSSSGLREGAFLGAPCVNIGSRQRNREHASNVINVKVSAKDILQATKFQIEHGKYKSSNIFGDGNAGQRIAQHLSECDISIIKTLNYLDNVG